MREDFLKKIGYNKSTLKWGVGMIQGKNVIMRPLELSDVYEFKHWGHHQSPLFREYDFLEKEEEEIKRWYRWKVGKNFCRYYVILKDQIPIGYISFNNINFLFKSAVLGLVINPDLMDLGYGQDAFFTMLHHYFLDKDFKKITLKVARYNKRAIHLYKKAGFVKTSSYLMKFPNGDYNWEVPDYYLNEEAFVIILGQTFFYADRMELTKEQFIKDGMNVF